jgi:hypothetical protein
MRWMERIVAREPERYGLPGHAPAGRSMNTCLLKEGSASASWPTWLVSASNEILAGRIDHIQQDDKEGHLGVWLITRQARPNSAMRYLPRSRAMLLTVTDELD